MKLSSIVLVLAAAATVAATTADITSKPTPAPTASDTTQATQQKAPISGCTEVSVEHDATYCIQGPICSGSGAAPAGINCPVAGDAAIKDCHSYLSSYTGGKCVAPVSATCKKIKTGAWGCVLDKSSPTAAPTQQTETATPVASSVKPTAAPTQQTATSAPVTTTVTPTTAPIGSSSGSQGDASSSSWSSASGSADKADNETITFPPTTILPKREL